MPILRTFTLKFKTSKAKLSLSPPASPTTASPTSPTSLSFETVGRDAFQRKKSEASKSMESVESEEGARPRTKSVYVLERSSEERKLRRMSRFKEELEDGE